MACKRSPVRSRLAPPNLMVRTMFTPYFLEQVDSTQDFIKTLKVDEPTIVIARSQTSGRGRQGHEWISQSGQGLWMSLAHPNLKSKDFKLIDFMSRVISVIPQSGRLGIKWPNDLVSRGADGSLRKLGGLIGEWSNDTLFIGLGINVYSSPRTFPPALSSSSLKDEGIEIPSIKDLGLAIATHYFEQKKIEDAGIWKWPQPGMTISWEKQTGVVEEWLPDQRLQVGTASGSLVLTSNDIHRVRHLTK